jgi:Surface adhesin CshA repetitive domain
VLKQFILGSLLVAGLTACPIEPVVPPQPASPKAIADLQTINPNTATSTTILPADNDIFDSSASRVLSSIDLDASKSSQQFTYDDSTGKGKFSLNTSTGAVTFKPNAGKTGTALATYTIRDSNGNTSNPAKIEVTISTVIPTGPIKVLFIGNSRTLYNGCSTPTPGPSYDIPSILQSIAASDTNRPLNPVVTFAYCGASLQQHWNNGTIPGTARGEIARRVYDYVVLQANTNETDTISNLQSIVGQFNAEIKAAGSKTILYMNWSKTTIAAQPALTSTFKSVATNLSIKLAPAGEAWRLSGLSDAQLYNTDGDQVHALPAGAYATAATFYWMFYNKAPSNTLGVPSGVSIAEAAAARNGAQGAYNVLDSSYKLP